MSKKILVLGANGMAGHVIARYLEEQGYSVDKHLGSEDVDLYTDTKEIRIRMLSADVVVNCVGLLVKASSENPEKALYINSFLPHWISAHARKLIHISTDCIFSGKGDGDYTEKSVPDEVNMYGKSKAGGEIDNSKDCTIRTSIIGPELRKSKEPGLLQWFLDSEGTVGGYTESKWNGVTTLELAKFIERVIIEDITGLAIINSDSVSKYTILRHIKNVWGKSTIINPTISPRVNKTIKKTRNDFSYTPKSVVKLLEELYEWYY